MKTKPQLTKAEIIDEIIVNGYAKDPSTRALDDRGQCVYRNKDGKRCAVGKTINNLHLAKVVELEGDVDELDENLYDTFDISLEQAMFKKYRGHEVAFWADMQMFHDANANYDEEGLTQIGKDRLNRLKEFWA